VNNWPSYVFVAVLVIAGIILESGALLAAGLFGMAACTVLGLIDVVRPSPQVLLAVFANEAPILVEMMPVDDDVDIEATALRFLDQARSLHKEGAHVHIVIVDPTGKKPTVILDSPKGNF
jgi:hypothetical protein